MIMSVQTAYHRRHWHSVLVRWAGTAIKTGELVASCPFEEFCGAFQVKPLINQAYTNAKIVLGCV